MLNLQTDAEPTQSAGEITTEELLLNLGRFPGPVLPIGLLRELQSRGKAIHGSLVALIDEAIESVRDGRVGDPNDSFFALALLVPIATKDDQRRIEALVTLPEESVDRVAGDLLTEAVPFLISRFFIDQSAAEVIDWIDKVAGDPNLDGLNSFSLLRGLRVAVTHGHLDRTTAIDALVQRLKKRADRRNDTQSALVVCELMDLSAHDIEAVDTTVRSSFAHGQVDTEYMGIDSWDDVSSHGQMDTEEHNWIDPATELSRWCYDFTSNDLDPVDASFLPSQLASHLSSMDLSSLPDWVEQLRQSDDEHYPREVVDSVNAVFADAYHAVIGLIREELDRSQVDKEPLSGNGAYLGLALIVANQMPIPTDLLQTISRLPEADRENIFGDQFGLVVQATALTPLRQHDFIEEWIWDTDRSDTDRREMVEFYLMACRNGQLGCEVAVKILVNGLRRAMQEQPELIVPHAECLAFMAAREHQELLSEAISRNDVETFTSLEKMRQMASDSEVARDEFRERGRPYRSIRGIITGGVMFGDDVYQDRGQSARPFTPVYQPPPQAISESESASIRSDDRTPRNALCPCGSRKKYKKCCLRKPDPADS